jgi:hypothetical protein
MLQVQSLIYQKAIKAPGEKSPCGNAGNTPTEDVFCTQPLLTGTKILLFTHPYFYENIDLSQLPQRLLHKPASMGGPIPRS